ncbi:Rhodocoxin reductase [Delftia tsuruhatensis]|uniref:FAD-dependent oxidoreductase n=1 Tax=Delftia tsuruhatensis TaxID=180282 RepID=UPI001E707BF1|nr:FAD-dependent oxidoreductase [Delftia tsuruhatensis]CAB5716647.1 Rhodocoxin reductase [Delftia tsuruhatensis]CAC9685898.1 Rhodocoxin reductase [Delftia tsuruhatensis]
MASQHIDFLLVGGGLASAKAAQTLRHEGATGSILILCAEADQPYHRPFLSKSYLLGTADEQRIQIHPQPFYREQRIEVALKTAAVSVDTAQQRVSMSTGSTIHYDKLLIATGATARTLNVPGALLRGIHVLRTRTDADALRQAAVKARRVVLVGGGFLGMELAIALRELGLEVTVIETQDQILKRLESPPLSAFVQDHATQSRGVSFMVNESVVAFHGNGKVSEVETASGARLHCDLVVVSVGIQPATQFLAGSNIELEDGFVVVDDQLQASAANVFAAGDVASFFDPVFSRRRHVEHWDSAVKQGQLAARNMLGRRRRHDAVSYFFCEVGDIGFNVLGDPAGTDECVSQGSLEQRSLSLFYLRQDIPHAVFTLGRTADEVLAAESLIRYRTSLRKHKHRLADTAFALNALPMQNVLILQGGGALGAFECGVVKALEEHRIFPDIVAGISIGAFNAAIVASHPDNATEALESFWADLEVASLPGLVGQARRMATATQIASFGVPGFFRPRWIPPFEAPWEPPWSWTSLYDTSPLRALLARYVDFPALKRSPVRLLVGVVNVLNAEVEVFDSYVDEFTPEHLMASGSLPPGFPWTFVNGRPYWDGGIVSNSPLDLVIERCGPDGKRVFMVDLFSNHKALPTNLTQVLARRDEVVYAQRVQRDLTVRELADAYRGLIASLMQEIEPSRQDRLRRLPHYIQLMGNGVGTRITRFTRTAAPDEPSSRDYDFSELAIRSNQKQGYALAQAILASCDPAQGNERPCPAC